MIYIFNSSYFYSIMILCLQKATAISLFLTKKYTQTVEVIDKAQRESTIKEIFKYTFPIITKRTLQTVSILVIRKIRLYPLTSKDA